MTTKEFIEKAIAGGWNPSPCACCGNKVGENLKECLCGDMSVLFDPAAWQAVGKVEGWNEKYEYTYHDSFGSETPFTYPQWLHYMHRMTDALAEGQTIEDFLETL